MAALLASTAPAEAALVFDTKTVLTSAAQPYDAVSGDFDLDGRPDVAVAHVNDSGTVSIFRNTGGGNLAQTQSIPVGQRPFALVTADFNKDGRPDIATANAGTTGSTSGGVTILLNLVGGWQASTVDPTTFPINLAAGDINGDGNVDLAAVSTSSGLRVLSGDGTGGFTLSQTLLHHTPSAPRDVILADLDGNGSLDAATANHSADTTKVADSMSVWRNNGTGTLGSLTGYALPAVPFELTAGDFNGDGRNDVLHAIAGSVNSTLYRGNPAGPSLFLASTSVAVGGGAMAVASSDINGDGKLDAVFSTTIATASNARSIVVRLGHGDGTFRSASAYGPYTGAMSSVVPVDLNADGAIDLVSTDLTAGELKVLIRRKGTLTLTGGGEIARDGATRQLTATEKFKDLTTRNAGDDVLWTTSNAAVAGVSRTGLVTSGIPGSATIGARLDGVTRTLTIKVSQCNRLGTEGDDTLVGTAGNDYICGRGGHDTIQGLGGNDVIYGDGGDDSVTGGDGNDSIHGGAGANQLDGEGGDDKLYPGPDAEPKLSGGDGRDLLDYTGTALGVQVDLHAGGISGGGAAGDVIATVEDVTGTAGGDLIHGDSGANTINGGAGADDLAGRDGADRVNAGAGNDQVGGGAGGDTLYGGGDIDVIEGHGDADRLYGEAADDQLDGGTGDDRLTGGDGGDVLIGGEDADRLYGNGGGDILGGGDGNDRLAPGADFDGNVDGGPGEDTIDYSDSTGPVNVDLGARAVSGASYGDIVYEIEHVTGSEHADVLFATSAGSTIHGLGGNDQIYGQAGADRFLGGDGDDTIRASAGDDKASGEAGNDTVEGEAGNDGLSGGDGTDTLIGGDGEDQISPGEGVNETVDGGADFDRVHFADLAFGGGTLNASLASGVYSTSSALGNLVALEGIVGSPYADVLEGDDTANHLSGGAGDDFLYGRGDDDTLYGGAGDDFIEGDGGVNDCFDQEGANSLSNC